MIYRSVLCLVLSLALSVMPAVQAQTAAPSSAGTPPPPAAAPALSQGELESMLAPIALYPDALISQMLMASTYPLEIVEAARWRKKNAALKDKALEDALQKQTWDESVKSLTAFPDVLERMNEDVGWTQKLGDAFLGQQAEVLATVQTLRAKAKAAGNLESNAQQKVEVQTQESKQVIVIEPANPEVVYVPTYQPSVVYGAWSYPAYPPYYPPYWAPVGAAFASGFFWGVGIAAGAALWGGCNWGRGDVNINVNRYNNFNRTNVSNGNWNHKATHRGAVPYRDAGSRDKYQRNDRQAAQAREQFRGREDSLGGGGLNDRAGLDQARRDPAVGGDRGNQGFGDRAGTGDRGGAAAGTRDLGSDRGGPTAGTRDLGGDRGSVTAGTRDLGGDRGGATAGTRDLGGDRGAAAGSGDRAGDRGGAAAPTHRAAPVQADRGGAFSGGNGGQTRAAADRGRTSMGGGGGASRAGMGGGASRGGMGGGASRGGGGGRGGGGRR